MKKMFYWGVVAICLIGELFAALNPVNSPCNLTGAGKGEQILRYERLSGARKVLDLDEKAVFSDLNDLRSSQKLFGSKKRKQISYYTNADLRGSTGTANVMLSKEPNLFCDEDDSYLSDPGDSPVKKAKVESLTTNSNIYFPATKAAKNRRHAPLCKHKVATILFEKSTKNKDVICFCGKE